MNIERMIDYAWDYQTGRMIDEFGVDPEDIMRHQIDLKEYLDFIADQEDL